MIERPKLDAQVAKEQEWLRQGLTVFQLREAYAQMQRTGRRSWRVEILGAMAPVRMTDGTIPLPVNARIIEITAPENFQFAEPSEES